MVVQKPNGPIDLGWQVFEREYFAAGECISLQVPPMSVEKDSSF